jgi:hypothetical protein
MKSLPPEGSEEFKMFVNGELDKIEYGVTINGVFIPGWLYWHINYWKTYIPVQDPRSMEVKDTFMQPTLRDNEWMVAEKLQEAKDKKCGLIIIGGRRIAKTSMVSSWVGMHSIIYKGSQNVIVGNNKGDIRNITIQMDKGLSELDFFKFDRLKDDWGKEVELGFKEKKAGGKRLTHSNIYIKNTEEGIQTEVLAGITPKSLVYDEIGKAPTKEAFLAGLKAFASPYGWRCVPVLTGTGGDFTKGKDAEEMFHNPERFGLLAVEVPNEARKTGVFISGHYAIDYPKKTMPLSEYLHKEEGSELDIIPIHVTDFELADHMIDEELAKWEKANDAKERLKAKMYSPRTVDDCFLSNLDDNPFPVEALKQYLDVLNRMENKPMFVKLDRDVTGKVTWYETDLRPVSDWPVKKETVKKAPVVIYQLPELSTPDFLYIAGGDPYNQDQSNTSPSLGTIYIYKRTYDPVAGTYQRRIVASYSARPDDMKEWHKTAELLLEMYNAVCMIENIGTNFIQYMDSKHKSMWLADGYNLAKEINPKSQAMQGKTKGLPATTPVQNHYKNLIIDYLNEKIIIDTDKDGNPIEAMGLVRIPDPMLITELINFRETEFKKGGGSKKKGNFDRYVSFGHVLTYEEHLEKFSPRIKLAQPEEKPEKKEPLTRSPFIMGQKGRTFSPISNPFGIKR